MTTGGGNELIDRLLEGRVKAQLFGADRAARLGRLVVLEPLGSGAMGTVFAAYDPTLDRRVAVKVLSSGGEKANRRLLREARALGKLTHPNVVAIHDAGEVEGAVYVVMELVDGTNLRDWRATKPTWRRLVRIMTEVALGLDAAHQAGLVHADVKPANILVGNQRVRVVDFGLARVARDEKASQPEDSMSAPGASGGTPNYMAPEVILGDVATAKADQFGFGVTLYECLYGRRPHLGKSMVELAESAIHADRAKRLRSEVPRWLHELCVRCLASDPSERFESMGEVARRLRRARRKQTRALVALGIASAGLIVGGAVGFGQSRDAREGSDPCNAGERLSRETLSPAKVAEIREHLGSDAWAQHAVSGLEDYAVRWSASHRHVCRATREDGSQSERLLEIRMRCLERQRAQFGALLEAIPSGEARERFAAARAVTGLADTARCEGLRDAAELELPDDPRQRAAVAAALATIDRGWAFFALGAYALAQKVVSEAAASVDSVDFQPLNAQHWHLLGAIEGRVGDVAKARFHLQRALSAAAASGASEIELDVWIRLLRAELFAGSRERVSEWAPFARVAAARAQHGSGEIDGVEGEALRGLGELASARKVLRRSLADQSLRGARRAIVLMNLGSVELLAKHPRAAEEEFVKAQALATEALGHGHPSLALYIDKLAIAHRDQGELAMAIEGHNRALSLREKNYGRSDRSTASSLLRRAETLIQAGQLDRARADLDRAFKIRASIYGAGHRRLAAIERARGELSLAAKNEVRAQAYFQRARELDPKISIETPGSPAAPRPSP